MFSIIFSSTMIDHLVLKLSIADPGFLAKRNILQFSDNVERVVMIRNGSYYPIIEGTVTESTEQIASQIADKRSPQRELIT